MSISGTNSTGTSQLVQSLSKSDGNQEVKAAVLKKVLNSEKQAASQVIQQLSGKGSKVDVRA